jgi:hypothetical protein
MLLKKVIIVLAAALAPTCASCSGNKIFPVSGTITYRGASAAGAIVFFHRQNADPMMEPTIMGIVQQNGSFELVCGSLGKGAPPGEYDVVIEWKPVTDQSKGRPRRGPDKLNGRYADPKHPLLHATVLAKATTLPAFNLTDSPTVPGQ